mgnify:CR=1 FL=1
MKKLLLPVFLLLSVYAADAQWVRMKDETGNAGKVEWKTRQHNRGKTFQGQAQEFVYPFTNVSQDTLIIYQVKNTCPCNKVSWTEGLIPPGQSGEVRVVYDGLALGEYYKIIPVLTNFDPKNELVLVFRGEVQKVISTEEYR